ncbi:MULTISPECIES: heavy metal-responsive transcriptional regulator [unclassified Halomonas]|uniref:Heavy metal-responsive transcriptional regulator n=1 Tax=Halomonas sp. RT37 TaxID=2950872 RepID=A0AAU7KHS1_9GAMM|nr:MULTISPECIES: heavy metal-responsive transcriptional regulator [unclassified Halomonas]MBR9772636.1 heavy metal-responsive transcriptional regulator [Gammaproteobacteria bacterium]MBS8269773.1 heavy metal-responsive transcriptional regulator [Halomonas litopenaei]KJZ17284.1 MerR family transcriptional regulator [Halomonas sp. S2151]MAR74691.1 heavy metal-responsive transcriptional regulator [Halomonas sp.]MAY70526.1 heavy metal-responsive transcriptional regulator [Halomonas sp.]|tara:strand:+ start:519 stop:926 length:408 start_codon:yes stop_codon:yes gene_type:complete
MQTLSIGELAERSGIASQAIRYYEKEKLMPAPPRTEANYRRYPLDAVARLQFIVHAKQWGFTLDEIRELLILQDANGDRAQAKRIAGEKLHKIREQIKHLSQIEAVLSKTLEECTGEGPMQEGCPIVDAIADRDE